MGGRFVLTIKNNNTEQVLYNARFVVQGHTDDEKHLLVHNPLTLRQQSIKRLVAITALFGFLIWSQDIAQAYLQSAECVQREVFVKELEELHLKSNQLLMLLKPLYGFSDSGDC